MSTEQPQQGQGQPSEEELRAAFEEQMRRITVPDVLIQTTVTLVNLGGQKLGEDGDLGQAKLAIEGARSLLPLLPDGPTPEEDVQTPIRNALSQLQMAFVQASQGAAEAQESAGAQGAVGQPAAQQQPPGATQEADDEEAERAKARAKIWTPPGA